MELPRAGCIKLHLPKPYGVSLFAGPPAPGTLSDFLRGRRRLGGGPGGPRATLIPAGLTETVGMGESACRNKLGVDGFGGWLELVGVGLVTDVIRLLFPVELV